MQWWSVIDDDILLTEKENKESRIVCAGYHHTTMYINITALKYVIKKNNSIRFISTSSPCST